MPQAASTLRVKDLVLRSPYFLLVFLFLPVVIIVSHLLHLPYKMNLLLVNNGLFLVCIGLRFVWYLIRFASADRYGAERGEPGESLPLRMRAAQVRAELAGKGYRFGNSGSYAEKRDLGYLGTILLYGGLFAVLFLGTYDNLVQYTGVVRLGIGDPISISKPKVYGELIMGPAASPEKLPMLQLRKMILPNKEWPKGAVEIGLFSKEGEMLTSGTTTLHKSLFYKGYEYDMLKYSYVADFKTFDRNNKAVFDGMITLLLLPEKRGAYTHYAAIKDPYYDKITGEAWFNPEKKALKVVLLQEGKQILDTELELWGASNKKQGEFSAYFPKLGQFAEIRVAHVRHFPMMKIGALVALAGLLLRLAFRPQRIWLEEAADGCRAKAAGGGAKKALGALA